MYSTPNKVFRNQAPIPYIAPQHHDDLLEVRRFEKILKLRAMNRNIAQKLPNQKYEPPTKRLDHDKHWPKVTYDSQDVDANSVVSLQTTALPKSRKHRHMPASNSKPMSPFTLYQNDSPSKFVVTSSAMIHNFAPKVIYSSIESNGRRFEKGSGPRSPNVQQNWPFKYDHDRSPTSDHMHLLQHSVIQHQVPQPIYSGNAFEPLAANADEDGQRPQMQIHYSPYQNDALK